LQIPPEMKIMGTADTEEGPDASRHHDKSRED
jgi:hypothetical protein